MHVDFKLGDSCELFIDQVGRSELDQKNQFYPIQSEVFSKNRQTNRNYTQNIKPKPRYQVSFDNKPSVRDEQTMLVETFKTRNDAINKKQYNKNDIDSK